MAALFGSSDPGFQRLRGRFSEIQATLRELGLDGWLLYDLHARNAVTAGLTGLGDMTRRYFVLLPAEGEPQALVHGIEETPWGGWPWKRHRYVGWRELNERLSALLEGRGRLAMEISANDAVPALDLVPAGVLELIRSVGVEVVSSGELVSRFHSRWDDAGLASHRRASDVLAETARDAFRHLGERIEAGDEMREGHIRDWVLERLGARGIGVGADNIVGNSVGAADPHYTPIGEGERFKRGDVVLLDLWGKEDDTAVFADQTWMGYLGDTVPDRVAELFAAIRDARDAAVELLHSRHAEGRPVQGYEVDDVARGVIQGRGLGDYFIHRTGHSIDRELHGMGPNIDNRETHEVRQLIPGVGFSVEPGVYFAGDVGLRTEINVFMTESGPEVTTPSPQMEVFPILAG